MRITIVNTTLYEMGISKTLNLLANKQIKELALGQQLARDK